MPRRGRSAWELGIKPVVAVENNQSTGSSRPSHARQNPPILRPVAEAGQLISAADERRPIEPRRAQGFESDRCARAPGYEFPKRIDARRGVDRSLTPSVDRLLHGEILIQQTNLESVAV